MRTHRFGFTASLILAAVLSCFTAPLFAAYEGISVSTSYPSLNVSEQQNGDMIVYDLSVKNYNMAPGRVDLSVEGLPDGWQYQFVGGGGLVSAVFAEPDNPVSVKLWVIPTDHAQAGSYDFSVSAKSREGDASYRLPLTVTMGQKLPERLAIESENDGIEGTPGSDLSFQFTIHNNSAAESLIDLASQAPEGFSVKFSEQYGSKTINNVTISAGGSSTIKATVTPPQGVSEGSYPVTVIAKAGGVSASSEQDLTIKGQPRLSLTGENGILSFTATAGGTKEVKLEVVNNGTAPAKDVKLSATTPSGWSATFTPERIDVVESGKTQEVTMTVKPSGQAITGDYQMTIKANSPTTSISQIFRTTIKTGSMLGALSLLVIAIAVLILVFTMKKFGRR